MTRTILLSYGLRSQTRAALDRARRFGHPIHLVPAIALATRGLSSHSSALVTVHTEVGRAGLLAAIGDDPDELVLLLHEDVLLGADAAQRLLEVAAELPALAVPATNHSDVDGDAGTLPPDVVQPLGPITVPVPIKRLRAVCLAGTAGLIRRMSRQRLTAAATRIYTVDGAVLVREAVATDLDQARDQVEEPVGPDDRPLVVASMIVRDEEQFLAGCLESLAGLVDRIEICDTGSTDATIEIARAAGAHVIEAEWRDDFAWARNQTLEQCRDAWWVLQIDADERVRLEDPVAFRRFLATAIADADGFDVPLRDIGTDGEELGGQQVPRIFPGQGTIFEGRIHEIARYQDGTVVPWTVTTDLEIEHLGYRPDVVEARDKRTRNLTLARAGYDDNPSSINGLQLARSLQMNPDTLPELLLILSDLHSKMEEGTDGLNETGHIPVYQLYAKSLRRDGRAEEAWDVISAGIERYPYASLLRAEYAEIGVATGHHAEVREVLGAQAAPEAARPWANPHAEAVEAVQVALSQLATDDLEGAGNTIAALLEGGVTPSLNKWPEIVSIVALTRPEQAVELLLPAAAADRHGGVMQAVGATFEPTDAAGFALEACRAAAEPTIEQRNVAAQLAIGADDVDSFAALADLFDFDDELLRQLLPTAGETLVAWLSERLGIEAVHLDLDATLSAVAAGDDTDVDALVRYLVADWSADGLRQLARTVPPEVGAPIAARAVAEGADTDAALRVVLALITVADDGEAAKVVAPFLAGVDATLLDTLLTRAAGRGATNVVPVLAEALLSRGSAAGP